MGFDTDLFKEPPCEDLLCSICLGVFDKPVTDQCGHVYCEACLNKWFRSKDVRSCPNSGKTLYEKPRKAPLPLLNILGALQIKCPLCKTKFVSLDRYDQGCPECYTHRLLNRNASGTTHHPTSRSSAPSSSSSRYLETEESLLDSDLMKWAGIATVAAAGLAGLFFLKPSSNRKSRE